jgi:pyridoxal phosphate enzyme (YggS family)
MPGSQLESNLATVQDLIRAAAKRAGRTGQTNLVAVSKTHGAETIRAALKAGQRRFGENRIQEAKSKWPELRTEFHDIELHLIGPLQTNKVKDVVALFDVIETVDREKLARSLAKEFAAQSRTVRCYVQINTGEEPQKAGVLPGAADDFIQFCRDECQLPITGLMCIPPADEEPSLHFALLKKIADRNGLDKLSMGMSHDFEIAIEFGATEVRIGSAIFGPRQVAT